MTKESPPTDVELTVLCVVADNCVVGYQANLLDAAEACRRRFGISTIDFNLAIRRLCRLGLMDEDDTLTSDGWQCVEDVRAELASEKATLPDGQEE